MPSRDHGRGQAVAVLTVGATEVLDRAVDDVLARDLRVNMPFGRRAEFERKRIPGADRLDLRDYLP